METAAKLRNSGYSPRKMRLLADLVRGMRVEKAMFVLKLHPKQMYSRQLEKLVKSAVSNYEQQNGAADGSELYVKSITVDSGRSLKRIQPAPQGRAHRIRKRSNHITVIVGDYNNNNSSAE